jgi:hypothetical protein
LGAFLCRDFKSVCRAFYFPDHGVVSSFPLASARLSLSASPQQRECIRLRVAAAAAVFPLLPLGVAKGPANTGML